MIKAVFELEQPTYGLQRLYDIAAEVLQQTAKIEVDIIFFSREEMRVLNKQTRDIDKETDVLSYPQLDDIYKQTLVEQNFPNGLNPETGHIILGCIAICEPVAIEQAKEYGHTLERELAYLSVHGLLHLFGYDHMNDEDKLEMREMEEKILHKAGLGRDDE